MSEPIAVLVKRWKCPHCGCSRSKRAAAEAHVARCWVNPDNRTCKTCIFFFPGYSGGGYSCIEGQPCNCNEADPECQAGMDLPNPKPSSGELDFMTNCPKWRSRDEDREQVFAELRATRRSLPSSRS